MFDVKVLVGVRERCEQWAVHRKEPFPIPAAVVASDLLGALRVEQPELVRSSYELDQVVEEVVGPHSDVMTVEVAKRRELYSLDRVMAEVSAVAFADRTFETLAVEAPVLGDVTELRADLGLESAENVSYPRLLRATLGGRFATEG